ncbi:MAG: nuclear transport factor 2 family protein, partial [Verrucomicrobiaceae bacterium]
MKASIIAFCLLSASLPTILADTKAPDAPAADAPGAVNPEQEIITLSKEKWTWMAEKNVGILSDLFHEKSVFVHMSGSMTKEQELETIRSGRIHYKHAEIQDTKVNFIGDTAILLSRIRLDAVVGGNEVTNPFMVTEVFVKLDG